jgi:hypothetical protein
MGTTPNNRFASQGRGAMAKQEEWLVCSYVHVTTGKFSCHFVAFMEKKEPGLRSAQQQSPIPKQPKQPNWKSFHDLGT